MPDLSSLPGLTDLGHRVGARLCDRGETVAIAESSAGGLISAALLAVPGASAYFRGGAVVYARVARAALLGIGDDESAGLQAETEPYARFIAARVRDRHGATWGLAESGAAGPTGSRYGDAPGHVALAIIGPSEVGRVVETGLDDRPTNMDLFARLLLALFDDVLAGQGAAR